MAETIADLMTYYRQPELAAHVNELVAATSALDHAFERQERAIEAGKGLAGSRGRCRE